jgi:hypothetical protein
MASLKPLSFDPVPPESVEDRWIGFNDGLETTAGCGADAVMIAVPKDTQLPRNPSCLTTTPKTTVGDKVKEWFKSIVH